MKTVAIAVLATILLLVLYLLVWPVPVEPVSWVAPQDQGLSGVFDPNDQLQLATPINLGEYEGPEDIVAGHDGNLYATTKNGAILKISPDGRGVSVFAQPGGRPLGIETDADGTLLVANAYHGLQRIARDGAVTTLLSEVDGKELVYADDVAVARNGTVYFSEASSKFGAAESGGTLEGSLLDILEHGAHGYIVEYKPSTGVARIIVDNLDFANGVAISDDQQFLLIAETGSYRILKHWLLGPNAGSTEVIIDNLPGFPDNINNGINGRFWIGLVAPRNPLLDRYSGQPFVRKIMQRMPGLLRPKPVPSSHVIAVTGDGDVLMNLQDSTARYPMMTGVLETRDTLYVTRLIDNQALRLRKDDLL